MVVTRRPPPPPTPSSRSSSNQTVPRMAKVKVNQLNQPEHSSPLANGKPKTADLVDPAAAPKSKPKSKWRRRNPSLRTKKGIFRRFVDFALKAFLAWLAAYSFFVCQNPDKNPDSTICHAVSATRYSVLEPYAYPLIKHALSSSAIEPYVREIEPYVIRVHHVLQPMATTAIAKFSTHVIPEWNDRVVPQYHAHVTPHVQDALSYLYPYLALVGTEYERYLAPYLRVSAATAWKLQQQAQPYVILAWYKSVDGYRYAKPYARPAWARFKDAVLRILAYLAVYRRQFVDPHVAQMWAKIKELSGDRVVPTATKPSLTPTVPVADSPVNGGPSTVATILAEEETHSPALAPTPTLPVSNNGDPSDPIETPVSVEPKAVPPREGEPQTSVVTPPTEENTVAPPADEPAPAPPQEQAVPVPSVTPQEDVDLDSFTAEIGLDQDEPEDEEVLFVPPPKESDEEREARLKAKAEETAWKRKEITDRHTNWEYQLEDLKKEQMDTFKLALFNIRKVAAKTLKKDSNIQLAISEFAADGDKYLRGAENYMKNLIKEKKQEGGALWERVVQKVKDKFEKRLDDVDRKVGDWYNEISENEQKLVEMAAGPVAELSVRAQTDIGLDYSWLDDVTTDDWVRYHDLMRSSDSFREEVLMHRNGTHEEALDNPVIRALRELRVEVDDIITGFESRLRRIQRDGERAFEEANHKEDSSEAKPAEDPSVSILPVADGESVPQVTIGKSPEQVAEALKEASLEDRTAPKRKSDEAHAHEEL